MINPLAGVTARDLANCAALARQGLHSTINDQRIPDEALIELTTNISRVSAAAKVLEKLEQVHPIKTDEP